MVSGWLTGDGTGTGVTRDGMSAGENLSIDD